MPRLKRRTRIVATVGPASCEMPVLRDLLAAGVDVVRLNASHADPEFFRQFDDGIPTEELGLAPVKVDFWGGWVWFNMDPDACPVAEYLGEIGTHLESYEYEKWSLVDYQTFESVTTHENFIEIQNIEGNF